MSRTLALAHEGALHVLAAGGATHTGQGHTLIFVYAGLAVGGGDEALVTHTLVGSHQVLTGGVFPAHRQVSALVDVHTVARRCDPVARLAGREAAVGADGVLAPLGRAD